MTTRREVLRSLALTSGALFVSNAIAVRPVSAQGAAPAAAPPAPSGPFTLPPLPYAYDALEPHLDATTMQIHHDKHHQAYVTNLNKAVAGHPEIAARKVEDLLRGLDGIPAEIRTAIRNQGGGHANHTLLWTSLKKDAVAAPTGELAATIDKTFGSFAAFQDKFNTAAMSVFGSGWAWLTWERGKGLAVETTANQDSPLSAGRVPLLGIDVWEHAYYLKFQNRRVEYVAEFAKVVDWDAISARARDAMKG
ncbi:MAG: superoxide dismutase [Candidatus Eisenbacteria bacterium]